VAELLLEDELGEVEPLVPEPDVLPVLPESEPEALPLAEPLGVAEDVVSVEELDEELDAGGVTTVVLSGAAAVVVGGGLAVLELEVLVPGRSQPVRATVPRDSAAMRGINFFMASPVSFQGR